VPEPLRSSRVINGIFPPWILVSAVIIFARARTRPRAPWVRAAGALTWMFLEHVSFFPYRSHKILGLCLCKNQLRCNATKMGYMPTGFWLMKGYLNVEMPRIHARCLVVSMDFFQTPSSRFKKCGTVTPSSNMSTNLRSRYWRHVFTGSMKHDSHPIRLAKNDQ